MTRAKRWIHPFHQETTWLRRNRLCSAPHDLHPPGQACHQFLRADLDAACVCDTSNIIEYVREARWLKVHHLRWTWQSLGKSCNCAVTDRANVAQFLGKDYTGAQLTQKRLIDCVNRPVILQRAAPIDRLRRSLDRHCALDTA